MTASLNGVCRHRVLDALGNVIRQHTNRPQPVLATRHIYSASLFISAATDGREAFRQNAFAVAEYVIVNRAKIECLKIVCGNVVVLLCAGIHVFRTFSRTLFFLSPSAASRSFLPLFKCSKNVSVCQTGKCTLTRHHTLHIISVPFRLAVCLRRTISLRR